MMVLVKVTNPRNQNETKRILVASKASLSSNKGAPMEEMLYQQACQFD